LAPFGALIGHPDIKFGALSQEQRVMVAAIAAGFTGLLSRSGLAPAPFFDSPEVAGNAPANLPADALLASRSRDMANPRG
jgi:hypothetical protein